jgi:hypothetical protein
MAAARLTFGWPGLPRQPAGRFKLSKYFPIFPHLLQKQLTLCRPLWIVVLTII